MSSDRTLRSKNNAPNITVGQSSQSSGIPRLQMQQTATTVNIIELPETTMHNNGSLFASSETASSTVPQISIASCLATTTATTTSTTAATNTNSMRQVIASMNELNNSFIVFQNTFLQQQQIQQQMQQQFLQTFTSLNQTQNVSSTQNSTIPNIVNSVQHQHPLAYTGTIPRSSTGVVTVSQATITTPSITTQSVVVTSSVVTTTQASVTTTQASVFTPIVTPSSFNPWSRIHVPLIKKYILNIHFVNLKHG